MSFCETSTLEFEGAPSVEELLLFLLSRAKHELQEGKHPTVIYVLRRAKADLFSIDPNLALSDQNAAYLWARQHILTSNHDMVAVVCEGWTTKSTESSPLFKSIGLSKATLGLLPGSIPTLDICIQDKLRFWQYVYKVETLADKTRYPGELLTATSPQSPAFETWHAPALFYKPDSDYLPN